MPEQKDDSTDINWGDTITAAIGLIGTTVGVASSATTECGQRCRAKCKEETGWLFSGRQKCIKACKAQCLNPEPETSSLVSTIAVVMVTLFVVAIIGFIIYIVRRNKK